MTEPLVTVVVPAFNRLDLVSSALDGYAGQHTTITFEVIVVDDGSEPPAIGVVTGHGERVRVLRQPNRGRSSAVNTGLAAARGQILIVCDSDVVPAPGFIDEHVAFHRNHPDVHDTHLGALTEGVAPSAFASLLGPRANPRALGLQGPVPWTLWYTDNWSVKRQLFDSGIVRFDESFHVWGWEDLELAHRLAARGVRNVATAAAEGRHLKSPTLDSMLKNFAGSVPNLLRLAASIGDDEHVNGWLAMRRAARPLVEAGEAILRLSVERIESVADRLPVLKPEVVQVLRGNLSNAVFRCGMQRGFVNAGLCSADNLGSDYVAVALLHANLARVVGAILHAVATPAVAREFFDRCIGTVAVVAGDDRLVAEYIERTEGAMQGPTG